MAHAYHEELLAELQARAAQAEQPWKDIRHYMGTSKTCYPVAAQERREIVRAFLARHPDLSLQEYIDLISSLCRGHSFDEFAMAGVLLEARPRLRKQLDLSLLECWLDKVEGWAETDCLCQSHYSAAEIQNQWHEWQRLLGRLVVDGNVHKRRASLVLLTKAVGDSNDERLAGLAFAHIDRLKGEKDILITKAVSWLLRGLIKHHSQRVAAYLEANEAALPRVAVRETRNKLRTGKKAG